MELIDALLSFPFFIIYLLFDDLAFINLSYRAISLYFPLNK